jgi:Spy/CpxP family protein refolding chaperone
MYKNRFANAVAVAFGFVLLCATTGLASQQSAPRGVLTANTTRPGAQTLPANDFAGLNYTADQKAKLDKIHRETESHKRAVVKDPNLTPDQKDAMLLGYTRMEYNQAFQELSPEQKKQVRQRLLARKASDQAAQKKQPGRN